MTPTREVAPPAKYAASSYKYMGEQRMKGQETSVPWADEDDARKVAVIAAKWRRLCGDVPRSTLTNA